MTESAATYQTNGTAAIVSPSADLLETFAALVESETADLREYISALELSLESLDWRQLKQQADNEFSREGLADITEMSRIYYIKNPLIQRSIDIRKLYVWGQGWTVKADNEQIQAVLDAFLTDSKNDDVVGSHEARTQLEVELETDGNLFFVFFISRTTGRVRVRTVPFSQVEDVICNPEDAHEPWYYKRTWTAQKFDLASGTLSSEQRTAYYPDWRYNPTAKPAVINGSPVKWDAPIYHVKIGGFSDWKFGVAEVYDILDWAKAYKQFLEDWASIVRAYRRFAFKETVPDNRMIQGVKAKLATTLGNGGTGGEANPPPVTGSSWIGGPGRNIEPIRTAGATVAAEDGRRLLLMVAAGAGLPETFYGDASVGSLATAKSLDRPTELMMRDRQSLWRDVFQGIFEFVLLWAVKAPQGVLRSLGDVVATAEDGQITEDVAWHDGIDADVSVDFPPILQHDIPAMVGAIVQAATLGLAGRPANVIDMPTLARLLLTTLDVPDVDAIMERMAKTPQGNGADSSANNDGPTATPTAAN